MASCFWLSKSLLWKARSMDLPPSFSLGGRGREGGEGKEGEGRRGRGRRQGRGGEWAWSKSMNPMTLVNSTL